VHFHATNLSTSLAGVWALPARGNRVAVAKYRDFWKPLAAFAVAQTAASLAGLANNVGLVVVIPAFGAAVCFFAALLLHRQ
jgi:hypothetical protein